MQYDELISQAKEIASFYAGQARACSGTYADRLTAAVMAHMSGHNVKVILTSSVIPLFLYVAACTAKEVSVHGIQTLPNSLATLLASQAPLLPSFVMYLVNLVIAFLCT